jgi:hypothetical protein
VPAPLRPDAWRARVLFRVQEGQTMHFFFPETTSPDEAEQSYAALKKEVGSSLHLSSRRVQRVRYQLLEQRYNAEVGQVNPVDNEIVVAIFFDQGRDCYLVCTPHAGMWSGKPIVVVSAVVVEALDFDP